MPQYDPIIHDYVLKVDVYEPELPVLPSTKYETIKATIKLTIKETINNNKNNCLIKTFLLLLFNCSFNSFSSDGFLLYTYIF